MSYVEENLMPNEQVIFVARIHQAIFLEPLLLLFITMMLIAGAWASEAQGFGPSYGNWLVLSGFVFLFFTIVLAVKAFVIKLTTELGVTNQRIVAKKGLIRRRTLELLLQKVESVGVSQNLGGRLMGFGTITITGTGGTRERFIGIASPLSVRKQINQVIQEHANPTQFVLRGRGADGPAGD